MHYMIIGNGGAGTSALQTIREVDDEAEITIISREEHPAYSPCSLPNLLSNEIDRAGIFRFDKNFYSNLNARFLSDSKVTAILPRNNAVKLENGDRIEYDKLLIATGAKPIKPRGIDGLDLDGVHIMGTLGSTLSILENLEQGVEKVVVIGGGFIGIEAGTMLKKRGVDVTIIELLPHILSRMLDPSMSRKVEEIIRDNNVELLLERKLIRVVKEGDVSAGGASENGGVYGVLVEDMKKHGGKRKRMIACDMIVLAIGVVPDLDVLNGSGINADRGILVDRELRTNISNIFAAGDAVEIRDRIEGNLGSFAIWPNAIEQGRVAGLNMAGIESEYEGAEVVNVLDVFGTPVIAMGGTSETLPGSEEITRSSTRYYKKLLLKENRIVGLQFVGDVRNAGPLYSFMKDRLDVSGLKDRLLDEAFVHFPSE